MVFEMDLWNISRESLEFLVNVDREDFRILQKWLKNEAKKMLSLYRFNDKDLATLESNF